MILTAPLYSNRFPAVERVDQTTSLTSNVNGNLMTLTVPMQPVACGDRIRVNVGLIKPSASPLICPDKTTRIHWYDKVQNGDVVGTAVTANTRKSPDWRGTFVTAGDSLPLYDIQPNMHAENIDPAAPGDGAIWFTGWVSEFDTTGAIPGEPIRMQSMYHLNGNYEFVDYYTTIGLTFGTITGVYEHPTVPRAYVYEVEVEGEVFDLIPTDFYRHQVGDVVGVVKETTEAASFARGGADRPTKAPNLTDSDLRPAPMRKS